MNRNAKWASVMLGVVVLGGLLYLMHHLIVLGLMKQLHSEILYPQWLKQGCQVPDAR
ncbi:hypothetical protein [Deinococcus cellulosilyticus]|uniref:hypothetical protein n=1 Tax=Deinococcus cellulosilyticus TaxID=401558 RepID=UPI001C99E9CF|nr:hypothetical protein [Deinococcus cellulosilyticus]